MKRRCGNVRKALLYLLGAVVGQHGPGAAAEAAQVAVDLSGYSPACGVQVSTQAHWLEMSWPMDQGEWGRVSFSLTPGEPFITRLSIAKDAVAETEPLLQSVQPMTFLTVGSREAPAGRPPEMSVWNVFFDRPAKRPFQVYGCVQN